MDSQDKMLLEIRDKITNHLNESEQIKPALEELVVLWRGSKMLLPIIAGAFGMVWAIYTWAKDHIK
jgi:hypothetical protein